MGKNLKPSSKKRLSALGLDYLVILAWMATLGLSSLILFLVFHKLPDYLGVLGPLGSQILFFTVLTLPVGVYLYVNEAGKQHATLGKRKVGIKVVSQNGTQLSKKQILVRTIVKLLPWELAHTFVWQMQYVFYQKGYEAMPEPWIFVGLNVATGLAVIYVAMVLFRKDGRGPHDFAAKTRVVLS